MNIYVLNGPNLNMLGRRDPDQYGTVTLDEIKKELKEEFPSVDFTFMQSNEEGELVVAVQKLVGSVEFDGMVANFAAFTHTSIALRDALEMVQLPKIEVHLSNIHAREDFRSTSFTGAVCDGIITGLGKDSYKLAVQAIISKTENR